MLVAGLRFGSDRSTAPLETKSGSYIYYGDVTYYYDWEFRTLLRIKLFDSKKEVEFSPTGRSSEPVGPDSEADAGISPHPRPGRQETKPEPLPVEALKGMIRVEIVVS